MKENILLEKSIAFAIRVINAYKYLVEEKREFIISRQFLQCGADIGAHVESAIGGTSRSDFLLRCRMLTKRPERPNIGLYFCKGRNISAKRKPTVFWRIQRKSLK